MDSGIVKSFEAVLSTVSDVDTVGIPRVDKALKDFVNRVTNHSSVVTVCASSGGGPR